MTKERVEKIRQRVAADYSAKVAWAEWTQAEKDRAMLLDILDALSPAGREPSAEVVYECPQCHIKTTLGGAWCYDKGRPGSVLNQGAEP